MPISSKPRYLRRGGLARLLIAPLLLLGGCSGPSLTTEQSALVDRARQVGATDVKAKRLDDGGLLMNGKLEGRHFTVAFPWRWNHEAMLFADGYRLPGLPTWIPDNPLADDAGGAYFRISYAQGFAAGRSAYDKPGMAVESGVESTDGLKHFLDRLGTKRTYVEGGSMGGDITVALVEKYPQDFAGGIAYCGAVGGWQAEIGWATDIRAAYNYFTRGTSYELPGEQSLEKSAIGVVPQGLPKAVALSLMLIQTKRVLNPVMHLFAAAAAKPGGAESRIVSNIAAVAGTENDPSAIVLPLALLALGTNDLNDTFGGSIYDNSAKIYSSPLLSAEENAVLNAGIQRIRANPAAVAKADAWYKPTGRFEAKLLTVSNSIDPLAPSSIHEPLLRQAAEQAGNLDRLAQRSVPPQRALIPSSKIEGYVHCGFTPDQIEASWNDLRGWVEQGKKPD